MKPFEPYIHGTNASIFSTLPRTNFQVMSPLEMIDDFQTVPMTGEITQGGYAAIGSGTVKESKMGKTSFGKISANGVNDYTLDKIIEDYARPTGRNVTSKEVALSQFKAALAKGFKYMFSNLNLMLILFARARHLCDNLDEVISAEELQTLQDNFHAVEQFYCFFQLIGTYIHPNFAILYVQDMDITNPAYADAIRTNLTFEHIVDKIITNKLDMKGILANPTRENLEQALTVLELPLQCRTIRWNGEEKNIDLPCTQLFCLEANYSPNIRNQFQSDAFMIMSQNKSTGFKFSVILAALASETASRQCLEEMAVNAKKLLIAFHDRIRVFNKLVQTPQDQFKLTPLQEQFLAKDYPLILVSDAEDKIELDGEDVAEYRCTSTLKIGEDIKIMATDTHEHRLEIMKFLELHQINNVQVILFDDLRLIRKNKEKPKNAYLHADGVPTLKWLAAKQIAATGTTFSAPATAVYSQQQLQAAAGLLEDAQQYQNHGTQLQSVDPNLQATPIATEQMLTPIASIISSLQQHARASNTQDDSLSFIVLKGFMVVLGITAVALALTALLNTAGLVGVGIGTAAILTGIGLFASNKGQNSALKVENVVASFGCDCTV